MTTQPKTNIPESVVYHYVALKREMKRCEAELERLYPDFAAACAFIAPSGTLARPDLGALVVRAALPGIWAYSRLIGALERRLKTAKTTYEARHVPSIVRDPVWRVTFGVGALGNGR